MRIDTQKNKQVSYPAPITIEVNDVVGEVDRNSDLSYISVHEETTITLSGVVPVGNKVFKVPVRRNDGRLFIFLAEVIDWKFSIKLNFPTCGAFQYSLEECNIDLPYPMFTVKTIKFDVLRKIPT